METQGVPLRMRFEQAGGGHLPGESMKSSPALLRPRGLDGSVQQTVP